MDQSIIFLYSIGGIISFLGFIPTIIDIYNKKPSANIYTYILWFFTTLTASVYGLVILQDLIFNIFINLELLACGIVLFLRVRLKLVYKK